MGIQIVLCVRSTMRVFAECAEIEMCCRIASPRSFTGLKSRWRSAGGKR